MTQNPDPQTAPAAPNATTTAASAAKPDGSNNSNGTLVLYVEDDPASRGVMTFMITRILKHRIAVFETTDNFLEKLHALPEKPDVVFMDIHIGPLDGYGVLELMKKDEAYQALRVIAMTASVTSTDIEHLRAAGYHGLIGKPIRADMFPQLFRRIMDGESVWFVI